MEKLRLLGYDIILRSAGSHSKIDVIGINRKKQLISCYQCKPKDMSENKKKELESEVIWLNGMFLSTFEVV